MKLLILLGGIFLFRSAQSTVLSEIALLTSSWVMLESVSNATGDKQEEFYQNTYLAAKSSPWKKLSLEVSLPFVLVAQTGSDGVERFRRGITDIEIKSSYTLKFLTISCAYTIPTGYTYGTSGKENLWLGSGSMSVRPSLAINTYYASMRVAQGLALRYAYYVNDGMVGWGSWETGIKGYLARSGEKFGVGLVLEWGFKSINYYSEGILRNGMLGKGYGLPLEQTDISSGIFASYPLPQKYEIATGISYTLYAHEAPRGVGVWMQLKKGL